MSYNVKKKFNFNKDSFFKAIKNLSKRWFIDAFTGMAQGLFVTLIAGTIVKTLGSDVINEIFGVNKFARYMLKI